MKELKNLLYTLLRESLRKNDIETAITIEEDYQATNPNDYLYFQDLAYIREHYLKEHHGSYNLEKKKG